MRINWKAIGQWIEELCQAIVHGDRQIIVLDHTMTPNPTPIPPTPVTPPTAPISTSQAYDWSTPEAARHSVRVICDEEGLTVPQKNLLSQVIHCESGYNPNIVHPNLSNGKVFSTDYGIAQWNNFYHGKEISPDDALHNPEKAIRLMCSYVKAGRISQWVCYSSSLYKKYSA